MININEIINTYTNNIGNVELPTIATRDLSLSPGMNINFDIAREGSLFALEEGIQKDNMVILVAQKDSAMEAVTQENLYPVGVLAKITNLIRLPYNAIKVSVKILNRVKITEYIQLHPYIIAKGEPISYNTDEPTDEDTAITNILKSKYTKYSTLNGRNELEINFLLGELKKPDEVIDVIMSHLEMDPDDFQAILTCTDTVERYKLAYEQLEKKINVLQIESQIEEKVRKKLEKMQKEMYIREKIEALQDEIDDGASTKNMADEYAKKLEALPIEEEYKEQISKEINRLKSIPAGSAEGGVIQTYIETILDLPWGKENIEKVNIKEASEILDKNHYGLKDVKERIIEYLSVLELTDKLKSPIICLVGPPGVGKTSIAKALAEASGRKYVRLSVGGTRDEAEIKGHRRTYIGAMPGRIITGIKSAKTNAPLFLLDEIDKLGADYRGDPSSALLEVLDPEQNSTFSDHYLEIPYDLSNVLFLTTANSLQTIPEPLLDRMEIIEIPGYLPKEKLEIAKLHLVSKQLEMNGIKENQLTFTDASLLKLISEYTLESGVRQLERLIAKICRKAARKIVEKESKTVNITIDNIGDFLGKELMKYNNVDSKKKTGKVTGLAYTRYGGDTLQIETVVTEGTGKIQITGNLGDVMQESARAALTYVRTVADKYKIKNDFYEKKDIHIHVPEGATPKDGPSAGITLATGIISALSRKGVPGNIAMTGEITLSGDVLPIGGLREKLLAASRAGVKTVLIPEKNVKDLEEVPEDIKSLLTIKPVAHMSEVEKIMFK